MTPLPLRTCRWCSRRTAHWVTVIDDGKPAIACDDDCRGDRRYRRWRDMVPQMLAAIDRHGGNLAAAGREFGTERGGFRRRVQKYAPEKLVALAQQRKAAG